MANSSSDRAVIDLVINGQQAQTSLKQVSLEVTRATSAIVKMKETDAGYNDKLQELHKLLAAQREMRASINDTSTAWSRFKTNAGSVAMGVVGGNIISGALSAAVSAIPAAIAKYREFNAASQELSAVTGATGKDLDYLNQTAARTGPSFGKSGAEMLEAYKLMASAKPELLAQKELLTETTKAAITLSQAGKIDLAEATKVTAESLNQFGESADQANRFINVIAAGSKEGAAEINEMGAALKNSGTVAKAQGVSFEQTNAILQSLSTIALKGGEAGTGLRNVLLTLGSGSDDTNPRIVGLDKALDNLGKKNLSTAEMTKLFGKENVTAAQHIITHRGEIEQLTQKVTGTQEAFSQAEKNNASLDHQLEIFWARVSGLGLLLGTYLVPAFTKVVDVATGMAKFLTGSLTPASVGATQAFEDQKAKVSDLTKNLVPLLDRHDELKKKTILTKDEQAELKKIVGQVAAVVPSAVTEFDKYGKALDINTSKARDFIKIQKELLKFNNKKAIEETQSELDAKQHDLNIGIGRRKSGTVQERDATSMGGGYKSRKMTEDELRAVDLQNEQFKQELADLEARKSGLTGDYLNVPTSGASAGTAPKPSSGGGGSGPTDEQKKATKKILDQAKKDSEDLEKLLDTTRNDALKSEQSDYDKTVSAFAEKYTKMYALAKNNTKKIAEIDALGQTEMLAIQQSFSKKSADEQQRADLAELKDIKELAEKELKLKQQLALLDVKDAASTLGSGMSKERAKEIELAIEQQFLLAKMAMYTDHYEAMMNASLGNEDAMKSATQDYNTAMATLGQEQLVKDGEQATASADTRKTLMEKNNKSAADEAAFQQKMSQQLFSVLSTNWMQTLDGYKAFWNESSVVQKAALIAQKAWALAEIAINLARQISFDITAGAIWGAMVPVPGAGTLYAAKYIALHTAMAALSAAAVVKTGVQGFADGGFTNEPSGFVDQPTLYTMGKRSYVAGEAGREFVISNSALQNPVVADFARMMDVAQKSGNYGALTASASGSAVSGGSSAGSTGGMSHELGMAILQQLQTNNDHMATYASRPLSFNVLAHERYLAEIEFARKATQG